jgi:hypothetical protein
MTLCAFDATDQKSLEAMFIFCAATTRRYMHLMLLTKSILALPVQAKFSATKKVSKHQPRIGCRRRRNSPLTTAERLVALIAEECVALCTIVIERLLRRHYV